MICRARDRYATTIPTTAAAANPDTTNNRIRLVGLLKAEAAGM